MGSAALSPDSLRPGAGNSACLVQCDMALRATVGPHSPAPGGPLERSMHQSVRPEEAVHRRRFVADLVLRPHHRSLRRYRLAARG
ncbi:unnamed protein product [Linum tenue]|uniref:Uncharacterized protein n=1 Tax=Linum tenue TaxID=586396 RepID=A0AAV0L1N9_9ROSI|nr:unnamed protein product [Linum tenue]